MRHELKRLFMGLATLLCAVAVQAVPAMPGTTKVMQPDGTMLTIRLVGDEYLHYNVTEDGYSIVRNERGFYVYAERSTDGQLVPTAQVAHDVARRQAAERAFLSGWQKFQQPDMTADVIKEKLLEHGRRQKVSAQRRGPNYDYSKFRGLVILVEYNDKTFDREDYKDVATEMINAEDYTGYYDYRNKWIACTGSVRDYFRDNSMGLFMPQFDVVGPVAIDRSQYYANGTSNVAQLMLDVVNAADEQVNFRDYDGDNDGIVDMIYFIFAGHGSNVRGNNSKLLWPHASVIYNPTNYQYVYKDGVALGRYACSLELYGGESSHEIDGIGTICHEFSHVLGLPDFYDTDYDGSGGESYDPGEWSLMSAGCYLNNSRTPAGYSLFERYMAGFAVPTVIEEIGSYQMEKLNTSNTGFRLNTPVRKEYFILENRQQERWDQYLPGHGMLVFRVDSTSTMVWDNNTLNANPQHNYYELVRARGPKVKGYYDPFPGRGNVTTLNNATSPANLLTWGKKLTPLGLINIAEDDGVISFDVEVANVLKEITLPETMELGLGLEAKLTPTLEPSDAICTLTWSSDNERVVSVDQEGYVIGMGLGEAVVTVTSDNGLSASCKVVVQNLPEAANIAEFKAMDEGKVSVLNLKDAQVLYVFKDDVYMRDATGALLFSNTGMDVKQNDMVSGVFTGEKKVVNKMSQFRAVEGVTPFTNLRVKAGEEAVARKVKIEDLTEADYADLVLVDSLAIIRDGYYYGVDKDSTKLARLYNSFQIRGISVDKDTDHKRYAVKAIYVTAQVGINIMNQLNMLQSPEEVEWEEQTDGIVGLIVDDERSQDNAVYNLQGQRLTRQQALPRGIYVVGRKKVLVK